MHNINFFGINSGSFESGGGSATADTNIYVNTSFDPVVGGASTYIYKNSSNAWVVSLISSSSDTRSSDGKISLNSSGTVQFTEADTNKNDTVEGVTTWTPRVGNDLLSVEVKNTIPYTEILIISLILHLQILYGCKARPSKLLRKKEWVRCFWLKS
jgi:hypothetical protein